MEIRDGFILGIYNYCDGWCERCPFTNRCRVFADLAEIEFEEGNGPLTDGTRSRERRRQASLAEFGCSEEKGALDHSSSMSQDDIDRLFANLEVSTGPDPDCATCETARINFRGTKSVLRLK